MKTKTSYLNENWDFMNETINGTNDYWGLNEAENNGYPFLKWQAVANDTEPPTINCIGNQEIEITDSESVYSVTGDEFDLVTIEDNYGVTSIENDFNYEETLNGAEFPVGTTTVTWTVTDIAGNTSQCSFDVIVTKATGINSMKTTDILIYPNPVNDKLFINCENNKIDRLVLVDITGKVLLNKQNISGKEVINLSGFKSGMYLIQINQEQEIHTTRIIKN